MGMTGAEGVWDEQSFEAMDIPLFAALSHPDAPLEVLEVLADVYVWAFYFDDALEEVYAKDGLTGVKQSIARASGLTPGAAGDPPTPADPGERALVDLWPRLGAVASPVWLGRYARHHDAMLDEMRWALANNDAGRAPNPIEYIDTRRQLGGTQMAADLVELGCLAELTAAQVALRPMAQIRDCFCDMVCLRNDLVSLRKEVEAGEALSNGVVVVQLFLGCDLGYAMKVVADLYDARRTQFDRLAARDLPEVFDDLALDADAQQTVLRNVEGLRDWIAGDEQWIRTSARYLKPTPPSWQVPTGLGTSAARLVAL